MKSWILLFPVFLLLASAPTKNHEFTGKVIDQASGEPLIGANVLIEGTSQGTVADFDGSFSLSSTDSCLTLVVSYTGYEQQKVSACAGKALTIALTAGPVLDEVVVVGRSQDRSRRSRRADKEMMVSPPPPPPAPPAPAVMRMQAGTTMRRPAPEPTNAEGYAEIKENDFIPTSREHISTFSIDVDAASYSNMRRFLNEGQLPPVDAVRSEEMINYFQYSYPPATSPERPFEVTTELAACPWNDKSQLLLVGMRARQIARENLPPANFVFLLDVSGSMNGPDRLPLLIESMKLLTDNLRPEDHVSIVVYAGASGTVLEPTSGAEKTKIKEALSNLRAGGSTAGAAGIEQAYRLAEANFVEGGNNRVILATDGDFNVGVSDVGGLEALITKKRESGIFLSVLGFGRGNLQDEKMQTLADKGNGNHAYIDRLSEARKVLVNEFGGTLFAVAKDVKIQMEFNPDYVASYRLIGYENRLMANEDFRDDTKDAGELGAGHTITALYELVPNYTAAGTDVCSIVRLRYKEPDGETAKELGFNVSTQANSFGQSSLNLRWAAAVAEFAMLLRESEHKANATYEHCENIARQATGRDPSGYRQEMVRLIAKAQQLSASMAAEK